MNSKKVWNFLMIQALVLWVAVIILGDYLFPEDRFKSLIPFLLVFGLHVVELPIACKIGMGRKLPITRTIIKTLLFGFTWWVPLKKEIIHK